MLRLSSMGCLLFACAVACGGSEDNAGSGTGGSGASGTCGIAGCSPGFELDARQCRCVAGGTGGSAGSGGSGGGASGGTGGITGCVSVDCSPGFVPTADNCSCVPDPNQSVEPLRQIGSWTPVSTDGAPSSRERPSIVWTGSEYIVWGGAAISDDGQPLQMSLGDGARYDPVLDRWTPVSNSGAPSARNGHKAVWTGTLMAVFGQQIDVFPTQPMEGALYDPQTDSWSAMSSIGAPTPRAYYDVVAVDGKVVVWGGWSQAGQGTTEWPDQSGGVYDPQTNTWTPVQTSGAPAYGGGHTTLGVSGGFVTYGSPVHFTLPSAGQLIAARYDLATRSWTVLGELGAEVASLRYGNTVITGGSLVSVSESQAGAQCFFHELALGSAAAAFSTAPIGSAAECMGVSRLSAHAVGNYIASTEFGRLVDLSTHELLAMAEAPAEALARTAIPAGYNIQGWDGGGSETDGTEIFVFGGVISAMEPPVNCPPGAPCVAPREITVAAGGAVFVP